MMNGPMPMIEIQVRGIEENIRACAVLNHHRMKEAIETSLERELMNFDYDGAVDEVVSNVIKRLVTESVAQYFRRGQGADLITALITSTLNDALGVKNE